MTPGQLSHSYNPMLKDTKPMEPAQRILQESKIIEGLQQGRKASKQQPLVAVTTQTTCKEKKRKKQIPGETTLTAYETVVYGTLGMRHPAASRPWTGRQI